jgi:two-component system sensor histidine kinase/response regulator
MALGQATSIPDRLRTNDPTLQTEFTLSLLEILASAETSDSLDCPVAVCQPLVEEALCQQIEQERLLNQVTTQIRQSLELPVILETAVEQLRHFLQVDRLLIYQFDQFNCVSAIYEDDIPSTQDKTASLNLRLTSQGPLLNSTVHWGRVTYEARSPMRFLPS